MCAIPTGFEFWSRYVLFSPLTFGGLNMRSVHGVLAAKGLSRLFQADSGTNLIKQVKIVKDRPCCSVAQLSEWSHGVR